MKNKWDISSVRKYCETKKLKLLSDNYTRMKDPLFVECECGNVYQATFEKIVYRNKTKCNKCNNHADFEFKRVDNALKRFNLVLIGPKPKSNTDKFIVMNKEKMKLETNFNNLNKAKKLIFVSTNNTFSIENIKRFLINENANIELKTCVYKSYNKDKLCFVCHCGNEFYTTWGDLKTRKQFNCRQCGTKRRSGKNHYFYNPNLTSEERKRLRATTFNTKIRDFRNAVFERDSYTCQICNNKSSKKNKVILNAHHLNGFHWFVEGRYDFNNGVTLCKLCHKDFHKHYGSRNNTREQFEEYMKHAQ